MKKTFIGVLFFTCFPIQAIVTELETINSTHQEWGDTPCPTCAPEKEMSDILTPGQTKAIALRELKRLEPDFIQTVPNDVTKHWCTNYERLSLEQRYGFWASLLSVMAKFESNYNTRTAYDEGQTDRNLTGVISTGLLQISLYSSQAKPYKDRGCAIEKQSDLIDPAKNLACAVAIMGHLMKRDDCLSCDKKSGAGAYWSVMREPYTVRNSRTARRMRIGKKPEVITQTKAMTPYCHN